jgi:hypothetical protein
MDCTQKTVSKDLQYKNNPRKITPTRIERLEGDLQKFGDLSGVVYCQNNQAYIGGNQRSKIFDGAEITIVEQFREPQPDKTILTGFITWKGRRYAYREVCFTEPEFREACIVANADGGMWDFDALLSGDWDKELLKACDLELPDMNGLDIDGLEENILRDEINHSDKFQITFLFDRANKNHFDAFIKENGKESLQNKILKIVQNAELW